MVIDEIEKYLSQITESLGYGKVSVKKSSIADYQCDDLFRLAKTYQKSPSIIGEEIVNKVKEDSEYNNYFKEISFCNPGFINIALSDEFINNKLIYMNNTPKFGLRIDEHKTYVIDYGGPNIAKPLHVGHMRPAIVGESIKRIIKYFDQKVISDVHYGDFGLQIGEVIYGIKKREIPLDQVTLDDLNTIYPEISSLCKEDENVKEICANITKELQDGNLEYDAYYKKILELSLNDIKRIYNYLDVDFDLWYGEMDSRKYMQAVEQALTDKNLLIISEGASVVDVSKLDDAKELPPLIFKKSNGAYLYGSTDMATIYQREQDFHPDYILYVTDLRQQLHFEQVFRASLKAGITDAKLEHLGFGTINGMDGKPYKTRSGETPKLDSLFKEVEEIFKASKETNKDMSEEDTKKIVNSILKFADLQNNRDRDYIFDIEKFSNVVGKTGPYMLYTYLRLNKIVESEKSSDKLSNIIYNDVDRNLRLKILELDSELKKAFQERMPSYIADYLYDLAIQANNFYQNNHINSCEDTIKKADWLYLISLTRKILKEMLELIIIDVPTIM